MFMTLQVARMAFWLFCVPTKGVAFLALPTQLNSVLLKTEREMRPSDYDRRCQFVTLPHLSIA